MTQGRAPQVGQGVGMPDFNWLNGLAGGDNQYCQSVTARAGGGQATATPIGTPNAQGIQASLIEIQVVATAGDSVQLPQAVKGKSMSVFNSTATSANAFASPNTNKATGALDTINGAANANAFAIAAGARVLFFCPRDGIWAAIVSA